MNYFWQFNYSLQTILDIVGLVQGTVLGLLLVLLHKKNYRSTFYLGLFLIFFSLKLIPFISISLNAGEIYNALLLIPLNFSWLLFPLFYIYTKQVSIKSNNKNEYWVLVPGCISVLLQLIIYFLPYEQKIQISNSIWYPLVFTFAGILYSWGIGVMNLRLLSKHTIEVKNTYSFIVTKGLEWARYFLIYRLTTSVIIHVMFFFSPENYYFKIFFSIIDLIAIYWVSYHGFKQRNIISILSNDWNFSKGHAKTEASTIPIQELSKLMEQIDEYMQASKCFVNAELTIVDVAKNLNEHPKRVSTAINTIIKQNFNSYVNKFRVNAAINLLKNDENKNLSIEGIGNEVGFQNKSTFYAAFKKVTGTTPTKFIQQLVA